MLSVSHQISAWLGTPQCSTITILNMIISSCSGICWGMAANYSTSTGFIGLCITSSWMRIWFRVFARHFPIKIKVADGWKKGKKRCGCCINHNHKVGDLLLNAKFSRDALSGWINIPQVHRGDELFNIGYSKDSNHFHQFVLLNSNERSLPRHERPMAISSNTYSCSESSPDSALPVRLGPRKCSVFLVKTFKRIHKSEQSWWSCFIPCCITSRLVLSPTCVIFHQFGRVYPWQKLKDISEDAKVRHVGASASTNFMLSDNSLRIVVGQQEILSTAVLG